MTEGVGVGRRGRASTIVVGVVVVSGVASAAVVAIVSRVVSLVAGGADVAGGAGVLGVLGGLGSSSVWVEKSLRWCRGTGARRKGLAGASRVAARRRRSFMVVGVRGQLCGWG